MLTSDCLCKLGIRFLICNDVNSGDGLRYVIALPGVKLIDARLIAHNDEPPDVVGGETNVILLIGILAGR